MQSPKSLLCFSALVGFLLLGCAHKPKGANDTPKITGTEQEVALSHVRSRAYQLVRDIRRYEKQDTARCVTCRTEYRTTKANADAILDRLLSDAKNNAAADAIFYRALSDSLAASEARLVVAHNEFLQASHMSDLLKDAIKATAQLVPGWVDKKLADKSEERFKRLKAEADSLRWKDFDDVPVGG